MNKINILDSTIFNRIAAGEVVENPRSVVKELVENSIDAGADSLSVEIRNGGIEYICVSDNGKGIEKEDMPIAFMPHATSKIKTVKDLETIGTLGFRGEALPSIASVADVEMISRTANSELGYKIELHGGQIIEQGECGSSYGTKVIVRRLFGNIPARAKFLRKSQMEESDVTEMMAKIILANPLLKIKYIINGKTYYQSDGKGVDSAIYNIYGNDFLQNMCHVDSSMPGIVLSGLIGKPDFTKHNRTYQTLIVNGRYIVNTDISYCIQQCYQDYLMKRRFPAYLLYLDIPVDMIDVNVHPNKLDVRFACEKQLKGFLYHTIKNKVDELAAIPTTFTPISFQSEVSHGETAATTVQNNGHDNETTDFSIERFNLHTPTQTFERNKSLSRVSESGIIKTKLNNFIQNAIFNTPSETSKSSNEIVCEEIDTYRYAGKLFNTYLLAENGENFYIIDQHAAHEKLLYDQLIKRINTDNTAIQDLLVPYIFEVTPTEKILLCDRLSQINTYGFKIDPLNGCSFTLYAVPVCCADIDLRKFISILLNDLEAPHNHADFIKESLMQAACKSAVKGEDNLTENEIQTLLCQMQQSSMTKFCPHGRPIIIQYKKSDLEKLFKRV